MEDLMPTMSRHSGIEVLESGECKRLLAQDVIGRVAVVIGAMPMIFPVNYVLDGDAIVMRTMPGSRLDVGQGHAAFEVDSFDRAGQSGWSVLVTGDLEAVPWDEAEEMARLPGLPVVPWATGERNLWLRLRPSFITGRTVSR
jgi:nitroimidazol reductase NimA-like FMN-containing flavoprotein (pyridoxamine 5'-phosphate oxidase superfamily)